MTFILPRKFDKCRRCGADIEWIRTAKGGEEAVQKTPYIVILTDNGRTARGREPHHNHCRNADK